MNTNLNEEEVEEIVSNQSDYIKSCVDKIYVYFHTYGYTWSPENIDYIPNRKEIKETIESLISSALIYSNCSTGRIRVEYDKDFKTIEILLEL
jgi:hypothetical protein